MEHLKDCLNCFIVFIKFLGDLGKACETNRVKELALNLMRSSKLNFKVQTGHGFKLLCWECPTKIK